MNAFEKVLNSIKKPSTYGHNACNTQNVKNLKKAKEEIEGMLLKQLNEAKASLPKEHYAL